MPLNQINILLSYYHEPKTTDRGVYTAKPEINNNKPFSLTGSTVLCQNSADVQYAIYLNYFFLIMTYLLR